MSVREEDRSKNCPSRGLGIAAAAIGVGVGAALYYFFNKRSENEHPDSEGSTSNWACEPPQTLLENRWSHHEEDDSYSTISEHSTTDTSVHDTTNVSVNVTSPDSNTDFNTSNEMDVEPSDDIQEISPDTSQQDNSLSSPDDTGSDSESSYVADESSNSLLSSSDMSLEQPHLDSPGDDSDALPPFNISIGLYRDRDSMLLTPSPEPESELETGWDVTTSSVGVPVTENQRRGRPIWDSLLNEIRDIRLKISPSRKRLTEEEQMAIIRDMEFRERSWSLEECSICFDVMLRDQEVMALQCTHRFHQQCILPWLQEKQTCPNCRKAAECEMTDLHQKEQKEFAETSGWTHMLQCDTSFSEVG